MTLLRDYSIFDNTSKDADECSSSSVIRLALFFAYEHSLQNNILGHPLQAHIFSFIGFKDIDSIRFRNLQSQEVGSKFRYKGLSFFPQTLHDYFLSVSDSYGLLVTPIRLSRLSYALFLRPSLRELPQERRGSPSAFLREGSLVDKSSVYRG